MKMNIEKVGDLEKKKCFCMFLQIDLLSFHGLKKNVHVKQLRFLALVTICEKTGPTRALDSGQEAHQRHLGKQSYKVQLV